MKKFNWGWAKICFEKDPMWQHIPTTAGIYKWERYNEKDNKWHIYIGQAGNLRQRFLCYYGTFHFGHISDSREITLSLYKHNYKLKWCEPNPYRYTIVQTCPVAALDEREKYWIDYYRKTDNTYMLNDIYARTERQVLSNVNRKEQIKNKVIRDIVSCYKHLDIAMDDKSLKICLKMTKKGVPTALSRKYFDKLLELLKIKEIKNEKNI